MLVNVIIDLNHGYYVQFNITVILQLKIVLGYLINLQYNYR